MSDCFEEPLDDPMWERIRVIEVIHETVINHLAAAAIYRTNKYTVKMFAGMIEPLEDEEGTVFYLNTRAELAVVTSDESQHAVVWFSDKDKAPIKYDLRPGSKALESLSVSATGSDGSTCLRLSRTVYNRSMSEVALRGALASGSLVVASYAPIILL